MAESAPSTHNPAVLMGWSPEAIDACRERDWPFVCVVPPAFEDTVADDVPCVPWDFYQPTTKVLAAQLATKVRAQGGAFCVPLYEETVAWSGALDAQLLDDPNEHRKVRLFLDKAVMKHRAQMHGIRTGACEEALDVDDVQNFWERVQQATLKAPNETPTPIHLKPIEGGGAAGHKMIRHATEIPLLAPTVYPCVIETHLRGQEFSCEAFVSDGELVFLNITEYVRLGHTNVVPPGPELESKRDLIRAEVERLIAAFDIDRGMFHPEYFLDMNDHLSFGEVAARVPGGHIFELLQEAYGVNPFAGFILACDPDSDADELRIFFADAKTPEGYTGSVMVHPKDPNGQLGHLVIPQEIETHPRLLRHNLFDPVLKQVPIADGFGHHLGVVFLHGDDVDEIRTLVKAWDEVDFFPLEAGRPGGPRLMPAPATENPPPFAKKKADAASASAE